MDKEKENLSLNLSAKRDYWYIPKIISRLPFGEMSIVDEL
jgi:hypothetical protein